MSSTVNLLTKLKVNSGKIAFTNKDQFPINPEEGQLAFVHHMLYVYSLIDNVYTWYPLTTKRNSYVHYQIEPSMNWLIEHNLNSTDVIYFIYDNNNSLMFANVNPDTLSLMTFNLIFDELLTGKCIVISSDIDTYGTSGNSTIKNRIVMATDGMNCNPDVTYLVDTRLSELSLYLPTSPDDGSVIEFLDIGANLNSLNVSVYATGQDKIMGSDILKLDLNRRTYDLVYFSGIWYIKYT